MFFVLVDPPETIEYKAINFISGNPPLKLPGSNCLTQTIPGCGRTPQISTNTFCQEMNCFQIFLFQNGSLTENVTPYRAFYQHNRIDL